jgi:hypothetical protein
MGSGRRSGGQHQQANYCQSAVIHPSRPRRHGSSCPTGAPTPEVTTARLVGLGRSPVSSLCPGYLPRYQPAEMTCPAKLGVGPTRPFPHLLGSPGADSRLIAGSAGARRSH